MARKTVRRRGARKEQIRRSVASALPRDKVIDALMELLVETPIEKIEMPMVAARAGVTLAQLRREFSSVLAIVAAHTARVDQAVLDGADPDLAEESSRDRLFDVLMRRLETLAPQKAAIRSLMRSAACNAPLGLALNKLAVRSQHWMLSAANIGNAGPKGMIRAQGLALLFGSVLRTFVRDHEPDMGPTMAALDRALTRGERWSGFVDDLCAVPERFLKPRRGRRRSRRGREHAEAA